MIKNKNIDALVKKFYENKMSHIFLMETNDKSSLLLDILELCKIMNCPQEYQENCQNCNICHLIDTNTLPTLKVISPDGQVIKKEQMEELKTAFAYKPFISNYNIYIVQDAEKFNSSSANTILKFIEEPDQNIVGFLITNNKENVIKTIKSRCEVVSAFYKSEQNEVNDKLFSLAKDYLYKLEVEKAQSIVYNKGVLDADLEKEELCQFFHILLQFYLDAFNDKQVIDGLENLTKEDLIKRINLVNEMIDRLNYNVNVSLLLDSFVLGLED